MKTLRSAFLLSLVATTTGISLADPASFTSAPVGLRDTTLKALSDSLVATAYTRAPAYVGKVASGGVASLAVAGSPGWATTRFAYAVGTQPDHFYVVLGAGPSGTTNPLEGLAYDIVANGAGSLSLSTGDDLSSVPAGTAVTVIPHWSLRKVFPPSDAGVSFVASPTSSQFKTLVSLPNLTAQGVNPGNASGYYFYNGAWRKIGQSTNVDYGDTVLPDSAYLIVHNSGSTDLRLRLSGAVSTGKLTRPVDTLATGRQDNLFSTGRPVPVALSASGFVASGAFVTSTSSSTPADEVLVYDNTAAGYNKSPSATYYYYNGAWRKVGAAATLAYDSDTLLPDAGLCIRKAAAASSPDWTATAPFPAP